MPKDFVFRGLNEEQLKAVSMDEFIKMLPSRMRRSLTRGLPEEHRKLIEKIRSWQPGDKPMKTHARNMIILPEMIGKTVHVFSGRDFIEDPLGAPQIPNWSRVASAIPDFLDLLLETIREDNSYPN